MRPSIKIRTHMEGDLTTVRALIRHPMETGLRADPETGNTIPRHFIKEVLCQLNGKTIMTGHWGTGIAKNPYISFRFRGASRGDTLALSWVDNRGEHDSVTIEIR